jgi:lysine 2,3-aminomutase
MNKKIKNEDHNNLWKNKSKGIRNTKELIENGFIDSSEKYFVSEIRKELDVKVPLEFKNQITKGDLELKLQFVPNQKELNIYPEEKQDPIGDESHSPVVGISHRYKDRVLFKPTYQCAVYCRVFFCKKKGS